MVARIDNGRRLAARALCVLAAILLLEAGPAPAATPPRITVTALAAQPGEPRLRVTLSVDNLDTEPLPIESIRFTLRLVGQGVLTHSAAAPLAVAALDRATLELTVDGDTLASWSQLAAAAADGGLPYEIFGNLTLARRLKKTLPFSASGTVPLVPSR